MFLEWGDSSAKGVLTAKLFEYLISGTPILAVGISDDSEDSKIIQRTQTGFVAGNDIGKIKEFLLEIMEDRRCKYYKPLWNEIEKFSRRKLAEKLLETILFNLKEQLC